MRSSKPVVLFTSLLIITAAAQAAGVDMKDPRRALGREDDIRVDAQLLQDTVASSSPLGVTYQVQNLTSGWIAVADRVSAVSYDLDSRTITFSIGAEIPDAKSLPHLVAIAPGGKRTFHALGKFGAVIPHKGPFTAAPRFVQITVNILRDISAFRDAIAKQDADAAAVVAVSNEMFDKWLDANDSIILNSLPVQWNGSDRPAVVSAEQGAAATGGADSVTW